MCKHSPVFFCEGIPSRLPGRTKKDLTVLAASRTVGKIFMAGSISLGGTATRLTVKCAVTGIIGI